MSVSSLEGSPVPSDLAAKYQKIASEYAKIRAQLGVLKKAVVDEQNHSSELREILRIKDQNLRKAEQETDSLNFRNQQLTKRVTILQDELESIQNTGKKGKLKGPSRDIPNSVLAEELQKKISENAELSSKIQEQTERYESEMFKLAQSKEMYEHELEECKKKLVNVEETKLSKLENANKQLSLKLSAKEEALQKLTNEIKVLKNKASKRVSEPESNDWKEKFAALLQGLGIEELLRTIIIFFRNVEHTCLKSIDETGSEKFLKCIESNITALWSFINSYSSYCVNVSKTFDFLSEFDSVSGHINSYVILLDELVLNLKLSKDNEVGDLFMDITNNLRSLLIQFLSAVKPGLTSAKSSVDSEDYATAIANIFRSLRSICDYFSSLLSDRGSEAEKESDKEVAATLTKIGAQSSAIYKKLTENKSLIRHAVDYQPVKRSEKVSDDEEEDCCRHWKEQYEAMNAAHSKKIKDLEEQISCLSGAGTPRSNQSDNTVQSPVEGKEKVTEITNMLGILTGPPLPSGNWENQEAELTKYFNARANALIAERQLAESKVTALKSECEALKKRLEHSLESKQMLEASIQQSQDTVSRLQEELSTTTSNYELQLSSFSEHMVNMNEKLAAKQEEIDVLQYQLSEKSGKKGKGNAKM